MEMVDSRRHMKSGPNCLQYLIRNSRTFLEDADDACFFTDTDSDEEPVID
jgi:hypothetical protein